MRASEQTYIQKLGFCDKDRTNPRHQQACEYLLERIWVASNAEAAKKYRGEYLTDREQNAPGCRNPLPRPETASCISVPIRNNYSISGFADVLWDRCSEQVLGEVKITPEPAEVVLQQINFYLNFLNRVSQVIILTDYDAPALKRLTNGSRISVYRLGDRFAQWQAQQAQVTVEEL